MAQLTKLPGKGTILQMKIATVFTTIASRVELKGPAPELEMLESTDLDSTQKEYLPGIPDGGDVEGTLWFNPNNAVHATMRDRVYSPQAANVTDEFKLIYPDNSSTTPANEDFTGFIYKFARTGMKRGELVQAEFAIKQTGTNTRSPGV